MEDKTWGMRFNEKTEYARWTKGLRPPGCPDWLEKHHFDKWKQQGLVVWNNVDKKIECVHGYQALRLLDELTSQENWKTEGVSITHLVHKISLQSPLRGRDKRRQTEPAPEPPKSEDVYEELVHLPPKAGSELIELLQSKKPKFVEMAEQERREAQEALRQVYDLILESAHRKEQREIDFSLRPIPWQNNKPNQWVCNYQSAEGRVCLDKMKLFWFSRVTRPGYDGKSNRFSKLVEAVEWIEKEIVELAGQPEIPRPAPRFLPDEQIASNRVRLKEKLIGSLFWIDPATLEPKRLTYRLFLELNAKHTGSKKLELECGDTIEIERQYPSPSQLATTLSISTDQFKIEQPIGANTDWYQLTSITTFFQEQSAAEQAQKVWDQSRILQRFKAGRLSRARYGYEEIETGFIHFLGSCEEPEKAWPPPDSSNDYMEEEALRETLSFAFDVNDYRDFIGASTEFWSDTDIQEIMHNIRARSKHLPDEIRRSSRVWIAEHEPLE